METAVPTSTTLASRPELPVDIGQRPNAPVRAFEENLPPEVIAEVREALKRDWFIMERDEYRRRLGPRWIPHPSIYGSTMIELERVAQERGNSLPGVARRNERSICNKATVFYWMQSATVNRGDADGLAILGSIWNTWADALGRHPQFQCDEFFAVPVCLTKKNEKTVPEILRLHKYVCSQVRGALRREVWPR